MIAKLGPKSSQEVFFFLLSPYLNTTFAQEGLEPEELCFHCPVSPASGVCQLLNVGHHFDHSCHLGI